MTTILLADVKVMMRQGLKLLLEREPGFQVVGEASSGPEALNLARIFKPAVIVVDLDMPDLMGPDVILREARGISGTSVVGLSTHTSQAYAANAFRNGISGFVLKFCTPDHLIQAIHAVTRGKLYVSPPLPETVTKNPEKKGEETPNQEKLTAREREIVKLVCQGHTNAEIASSLAISKRTVETHRSNLMRKLAIHNQTGLMLYARTHGYLPGDEM